MNSTAGSLTSSPLDPGTSANKYMPHLNLPRPAACSPAQLGLLASSIISCGSIAGALPRWKSSSAEVRNDPERTKTQNDYSKINAAQAKRDRKTKKSILGD